MASHIETSGGHEAKTVEHQLLDLFIETRDCVYAAYEAFDETYRSAEPKKEEIDTLFGALERDQLRDLMLGVRPRASEEFSRANDLFRIWAGHVEAEQLLKHVRRAYVAKQNQIAMELIGGKRIHAKTVNPQQEHGIRIISGPGGSLDEVTGTVFSVETDVGTIVASVTTESSDEKSLYWINTFSPSSYYFREDSPLATDFEIIG